MKMPVISGGDLIKLLAKKCFELLRKRGSHVIMNHKDISTQPPVVIPTHPELKPGTLLEILKQAGLSRDEFLGLYHGR